MSDSRFAVLGGLTNSSLSSSYEALMVTEGAHWVSFPPMHRARSSFVCAAVARCIIVAGGYDTRSSEVYDEALNRWIRLPFDFFPAILFRGRCVALFSEQLADAIDAVPSDGDVDRSTRVEFENIESIVYA